ncbi:cilia- and flagella-associated protein 53 [Drosophila tropicalis]|uniref:cilia- and flagella-associated protein 53 n=1 Tax=Drosophila tropicalis TaxID=46794 RepID=UPI0035ABE6FD
MNTMEFLNRTNHRNLKSQISLKVAQRMQEYAQDLESRRWALASQLHAEAIQYDEEVAQILLAQAEKAEEQRYEWIEMELLKRAEAEAELVKIKQQQRELESSESHRHMQSKQILLETKQGQLQQITERQKLRQREICVKQLWHRVWQKLDETKEQQLQYEEKLRRRVETQRQAENCAIHEEKKLQLSQEILNEQRTYAQAMESAAQADGIKKQQELLKVQGKRMQQLADLQDQINRNVKIASNVAEANYQEDMGYNIREDSQIFDELMDKHCARARNREWHQSYMCHTALERAGQRKQQLQHEHAFLGTGCVISQQLKQPYGKEVR